MARKKWRPVVIPQKSSKSVKINGWNQRKSPNWKGKSPSKPPVLGGSSRSFFQGGNPWAQTSEMHEDQWQWKWVWRVDLYLRWQDVFLCGSGMFCHTFSVLFELYINYINDLWLEVSQCAKNSGPSHHRFAPNYHHHWPRLHLRCRVSFHMTCLPTKNMFLNSLDFIPWW